MKENENVSKKENTKVKKAPKMIVFITVGIILMMLLGMQVFASTKGYGNVFFMIKELVTTGSVQGEKEIFSDKEITLSYKSIDLVDGVKMQVNKLEIKENESTLCLHITADEKNKILPLTYEIMSKELEKTEVKGENTNKTIGDIEERLTVKHSFADNENIVLVVKDKDGKTLKQLEINLDSHEIFVKGESEVEKISEIELKKYLSAFSRLNNDSEKTNQLIQIAYDIHEIAAPGIQDAPEISKMNEAIKEFYGDKVEFVKDKNKAGKEIEIIKINGQKATVSDKLDIYVNAEDLDNTQKGICLKIEDIKYENGIYTVKYIYTLATKIQTADNKIEELPQYEATIKLKRNENAKYSKYQVVELSKSTEVKEKVSTKVADNKDTTKKDLEGVGITGEYEKNNENNTVTENIDHTYEVVQNSDSGMKESNDKKTSKETSQTVSDTTWKQICPEWLGMKFKVPNEFNVGETTTGVNNSKSYEVSGIVENFNNGEDAEIKITFINAFDLDNFDFVEYNADRVVESTDNKNWSAWNPVHTATDYVQSPILFEDGYVRRTYARKRGNDAEFVVFDMKIKSVDVPVYIFMENILKTISSTSV